MLIHASSRLSSSQWIGWVEPDPGWLKLNTGGSFKSTSSLASVGGLVQDDNGAWEWGFTLKVDKADSFTAKLWGLMEGLWLCWERGVHKVIVEMDSKWVVDVMADSFSHEKEWETLMDDYMFLASMLTNVRFVHVLREGNRCADMLANLGHGSDWGTTMWEDPPEDIDGHLLAYKSKGQLT